MPKPKIVTTHIARELFHVSFNGGFYGSIDMFENSYRYFPVNQHEITGDMYKQIGKELNRLEIQKDIRFHDRQLKERN